MFNIAVFYCRYVLPQVNFPSLHYEFEKGKKLLIGLLRDDNLLSPENLNSL